MPTRELVDKLITHNPDYWGTESGYGKPLTETRLGRLVTQAAKVTSIRRGGVPPRGYLRSQLQPVWRRLGIAPLGQPDEPDEPDEPDGKTEPTAGSAGFADFAGFKQTQIRPDGNDQKNQRDVDQRGHHGGDQRGDQPPGGPTDRTPGMTDRVRDILAKRNGHPVDGNDRQPMCPGCGTYVAVHGQRRRDCTDQNNRQALVATRIAEMDGQE